MLQDERTLNIFIVLIIKRQADFIFHTLNVEYYVTFLNNN